MAVGQDSVAMTKIERQRERRRKDFEKRLANKLSLLSKSSMLSALIDEWSEKTKNGEYNAEDWTYLRDLKARRLRCEAQLKSLSV